MTTGELIAIGSIVINSGSLLLVWSVRREIKGAVSDALLKKTVEDLKAAADTMEVDIQKLRDWKHNILVPWQQRLIQELDDRYLLRRDLRNGNAANPERRGRH